MAEAEFEGGTNASGQRVFRGEVVGGVDGAGDAQPFKVDDAGGVRVSQTGAANLATGTATAGAVSSLVVAARATRRSVVLRNEEAAGSGNDARLGTGGTNHFLLKAGEGIVVDSVAAITCARTGANDAALSWAETYD